MREPEEPIDPHRLEIWSPIQDQAEGEAISYGWVLVAQNKKVLKGWRELCSQIRENATRCYVWLRNDPTRHIPGRCYEMKHKHYAGAWAYEVGSGQRVYYKIRYESREVL